MRFVSYKQELLDTQQSAHPPLRDADADANINSTQSADANINEEVSSVASADAGAGIVIACLRWPAMALPLPLCSGRQ